MLTNSQFVLRGLALAVAIGAASQVVEAGEVVEGKLIADQRGHLSAQMTGERSQRVKDMHVRVGDPVKKGDLLARLDTEQLEADRLIAQRALEEAQASVEVAKSSVARARLDYDRRAGLRGSPSFNRAAFEDAEVELRAADSRLKSAQSSAGRREAEVARINVEIRLAEIKAPYDGIVLDVLTSVGASVTQRAPDLLTLLDLSQVEIAVQIPQSEAQRLKPGQIVGYSLADGEKRMARVRAVLPPVSPQETAPVMRLQLDSVDLPLVIRHQQPVRVYLGE
jgi:RND family efflux transporter MFP subunit